MHSISVRVEVADSIGAGIPQQVSGTVYLPDHLESGRREWPTCIISRTLAASCGSVSPEWALMHAGREKA